jgi:hypothetical protein
MDTNVRKKEATTDGADNTDVWGAHAARVLVFGGSPKQSFEQKATKITKFSSLDVTEPLFPLLPSV